MRSFAKNKLFTAAACVLMVWMLLALSGCAQPGPKNEKGNFMFWPAAPDPPRIQFLTSIRSSQDITEKQGSMEDILYGADKTKVLPFYRPYGVRMAGGNLYVCDASFGTLSIIDFRNKLVRVIGTNGPIHLLKPIDVAVAEEGTRYVADTGTGAVMVYDAKDNYAGKVAVKGMRPVSVAVTARELYVSDIANSKVRVFDRFNGKELRTIGEAGSGDGQFGGSMGLCLDGQGNLYVNDVISCRVQKFSPEGKFISSIGGLGTGAGKFVRPKLMTVDASGILYVVDNAFQNVQMFNSEGKMLTFFGGQGKFPGAMEMPTGVCTSDADLDVFAKFVHPAFNAQRLLFVTNNAGPNRINVYALGELKPGKTLADISNRVQGIFGFDTTPNNVDILSLPSDANDPTTTQPATQPGAGAPADAVPAATRPATRPSDEQRPF